MTEAYFDNSATTAPCCEAVKAVTEAMTQSWGNPSSLHAVGNRANALLESSRNDIASRLSCSPEEIFFTSGGTESNNLAVMGAAYQMRRMGRRIVSTSVEHSSIDDTLNRLEAEGFEVIKLRVDSYGRINEKELYAAVNSNTILITMMLVNNEIGTIMPVQAAKRAAMMARSPALIHCDAVQAFGKMPVKPATLGVDLMTVSSHKIHGPKGVGALYIRKGVKIKPRTFGGEQEKKYAYANNDQGLDERALIILSLLSLAFFGAFALYADGMEGAVCAPYLIFLLPGAPGQIRILGIHPGGFPGPCPLCPLSRIHGRNFNIRCFFFRFFKCSYIGCRN